MPRPLKVFRAHLGFYDTVVAVPSQKKREDARRAAVAEAELAEIAAEETKLRERRRKLQKTLKVHAVK
jgi:hypothetical protein